MRIAGLALLAGFAWIAGASQTHAAGLAQSAKNAALIRAHHDELNRGDWQTALSYFAEETKNHGRPVGRKVVGRILEDIYTTFPDFRLDIVDLVAKDDWVVVRCRESGTHRGMGRLPVNGGLLLDVPPTGKHFEVQVIHWYTMLDGKIVEHHANRDDLGMMQQLGLLPAEKPFDWVHLKPLESPH